MESREFFKKLAVELDNEDMDKRFKHYRKVEAQPMRSYVPGEDMTGISVSEPDKKLPTLEGGMIARSAKDPEDMWYVAKEFFKENYRLIE